MKLFSGCLFAFMCLQNVRWITCTHRKISIIHHHKRNYKSSVKINQSNGWRKWFTLKNINVNELLKYIKMRLQGQKSVDYLHSVNIWMCLLLYFPYLDSLLSISNNTFTITIPPEPRHLLIFWTGWLLF